LEAYENKDVDKLYNEFNSYTKERESLTDELNNAFEHIDGNITTVETIRAGNNAGKKDENGYVEADYVARMKVKTDKNRNYEISIYGIYFYRGDEMKEGINRIYIENGTNGTITVGVYKESE